MKNKILGCLNSVKYRDILVDNKLNFSKHMLEKVKKVNSMLNIKKKFKTGM